MALDNILSAITQETDKRIADAKDAHAKKIATMREQSDKRLLAKKQEINEQRKEKETFLRAKADTHLSQRRRNAMLSKKQELLERCYAGVQTELAQQKPAALEAFLSHCLKSIKNKGEIRPAKAQKDLLEKLADKSRFTIGKPVEALGGFVFVSDTQESDFTFESFVSGTLRPRTEVAVSHALFN